MVCFFYLFIISSFFPSAVLLHIDPTNVEMPSSSSSSIYSYRPGGSLKFKGGESLPTKKKKKSNSKSKSSINKEIRSKEDLKSSSKGETEEKVQSIDDDEGVSEEQNKSEKNMTEAEKKFQEIKRKRVSSIKQG